MLDFGYIYDLHLLLEWLHNTCREVGYGCVVLCVFVICDLSSRDVAWYTCVVLRVVL